MSISKRVSGLYNDAISFIIATGTLLLVANVALSFGSYFVINIYVLELYASSFCLVYLYLILHKPLLSLPVTHSLFHFSLKTFNLHESFELFTLHVYQLIWVITVAQSATVL